MSEETGSISEKLVRVVETRTLEDGTIQMRYVTEKRVIIECSDWAVADEESDLAAVNKPDGEISDEKEEEEEMADDIVSSDLDLSDQAVESPDVAEQGEKMGVEEKEDGKAEDIADEIEAGVVIESPEIIEEDSSSVPSVPSPSMDSDKENVDPADKRDEAMEDEGEMIKRKAPETPSMPLNEGRGVPSTTQENSLKEDSSEKIEEPAQLIPSTPISLLNGKRKSLFGSSARRSRSPSVEKDNGDEEPVVEGDADAVEMTDEIAKPSVVSTSDEIEPADGKEEEISEPLHISPSEDLILVEEQEEREETPADSGIMIAYEESSFFEPSPIDDSEKMNDKNAVETPEELSLVSTADDSSSQNSSPIENSEKKDEDDGAEEALEEVPFPSKDDEESRGCSSLIEVIEMNESAKAPAVEPEVVVEAMEESEETAQEDSQAQLIIESPASPTDEEESPGSPDEVVEEVEPAVIPEPTLTGETEDIEDVAPEATIMDESPASPTVEQQSPASPDEVIDEDVPEEQEEPLAESPASPIDERDSPASPDEVIEEEAEIHEDETEDIADETVNGALDESPASPIDERDSPASPDEVPQEDGAEERTDTQPDESEEDTSKEGDMDESPASPIDEDEQESPASPDEVPEENADEDRTETPAEECVEDALSESVLESPASPDEVVEKDNSEEQVAPLEEENDDIAEVAGDQETEEVESNAVFEESSASSSDDVIEVAEKTKDAVIVEDPEAQEEPLADDAEDIVEDQEEEDSEVAEESPASPTHDEEDSMTAPPVEVVTVDETDVLLVDVALDHDDVAVEAVGAPANEGVIEEDDDDIIVEDDEHSPIRVMIEPAGKRPSALEVKRHYKNKNTARKSTGGKRQRENPATPPSEAGKPQQKKRRRREEEVVEVLDEPREPSSPPEITRSPEEILKEILANVDTTPAITALTSSDSAPVHDEIVLDDDDDVAPVVPLSTMTSSTRTITSSHVPISPELAKILAEATRPSPDRSENIEIVIAEESRNVPAKRGPPASIAAQPSEKRRKSAEDSSSLSPASAFAAANKTADTIMEIARNQDQRVVRANPAMVMPVMHRVIPRNDDEDDIQIIEDEDEVQIVGVSNHRRPTMISQLPPRPPMPAPRPLQGPTGTVVISEGAAINIGALKASTTRNVPPQVPMLARPTTSHMVGPSKNPAPRSSLEIPSTSAFVRQTIVPRISAPRIERVMINGASTPSSSSLIPTSSSSSSRLSNTSIAAPSMQGRPSTSPNTLASLLQPIVPRAVHHSPTKTMATGPSPSSVTASAQKARIFTTSRREDGTFASVTTPNGLSSSVQPKSSSKPTSRNGTDASVSKSPPISQTETIDLSRDSSPEISIEDEPSTSTAQAKRLPQKKPIAKTGSSSAFKRKAVESSDEDEEPAKKRVVRLEKPADSRSPSETQEKEEERNERTERRQLRARNNTVDYAENDADDRRLRRRGGATANRANEIDAHEDMTFMKMSSPRSPPRSIAFDKNGSMILPAPVPRRRRTDSTSSSKAGDLEEKIYNDLRSLSPTGITIREELVSASGLNETEKLFHELSLIEPFVEGSEEEEAKAYILEKGALGRSPKVKRWNLASYQNCLKYSLDRTTMPDETFRSRKVCEVVAHVKEMKPILLARLEPKDSGPYKIEDIIVAVEFDLAYRLFPKSLNIFIENAKKQERRRAHNSEMFI